MLKALRLKTIFTLSILFLSVTNVSSQPPILVPSDNVSWSPVSESNENYKNLTVYTRTIDRDRDNKPFKAYIQNFPEGEFQAQWKGTGIGIFGSVIFCINGERKETLKKGDSPNYTWIGKNNRFIVTKSDNLSLELSFNKSGEVYIAFPGNVTQSLPNRVPEQPEILSGPDKGYNNSSIAFSVKSNDPDGDPVSYIIDWGNDTNSTIGPVESGRIALANHEWINAGIYEIKVVATDGKGKSIPSLPIKIEIFWLVKVPPMSPLQHVIDNLKSNTTLLLEGKDYIGPIDITNINHINILSNNTLCNITANAIGCNYAIGLENANNISLNGLNISSCHDGIYLHNCFGCKISNNNIYYEDHGIQMAGGHENDIERNYINPVNTQISIEGCTGISLEDTWDNRIICNNITESNKLDPIFYIRNSTIKNFKIIIPLIHGIIIQYDPSMRPLIDNNECCYNLTGKNWVCQQCRYDSREISRNINCAFTLPELCDK